MRRALLRHMKPSVSTLRRERQRGVQHDDPRGTQSFASFRLRIPLQDFGDNPKPPTELVDEAEGELPVAYCGSDKENSGDLVSK